jgi:hypothetical protein
VPIVKDIGLWSERVRKVFADMHVIHYGDSRPAGHARSRRGRGRGVRQAAREEAGSGVSREQAIERAERYFDWRGFFAELGGGLRSERKVRNQVASRASSAIS